MSCRAVARVQAKLVFVVTVVWPGSTAYAAVFERVVAPVVRVLEAAAAEHVLPRARVAVLRCVVAVVELSCWPATAG